MQNPLRQEKSGKDYLEQIGDNPSEKCQIIDYIDGSRNTRILEVGPGSGSGLLELVERIKSNGQVEPELVVCDLMHSILSRTRELLKPKWNLPVLYAQANLLEGLPFQNNSINGINLSSVLHECFTSGGFSAINRLAAEFGRVLCPEGVITYRDPDGVLLNEEQSMRLDSKAARGFFLFFIKRFLASSHVIKGKESINYKDSLRIGIDGRSMTMSDFKREDISGLEDQDFMLKGKSGLMHEIRRHFMVFITDTVPEILVASTENEDGTMDLEFAKKKGGEYFESYCRDNGLSWDSLKDVETGYRVDNLVWEQFSDDTEKKLSFLTKPVEIFCNNDEASREFGIFLASNKIEYSLEDKVFSISLSDFNLHYDKISIILDKLSESLNLNSDMVDQACKWASREGTESYYYGSPEEIIVRFAKHSLVEDDKSIVGYSCLCPISANHNTHVDRDFYTQYLRKNFISDPAVAPDGKRNIHFQKMPIEQALPVLLKLYLVTGSLDLLDLLSSIAFLLNDFITKNNAAHCHLSEETTSLLNDESEFLSVCEKVLLKKTLQELSTKIGISTLKTEQVGLVGGIASGKTTIANLLEGLGFTKISLSEFIEDQLAISGVELPDRDEYFRIGIEMRQKGGKDILARLAVKRILKNNLGKFVIEGIRTAEEVTFLRETFRNLLLIGIETEMEERVSRVLRRGREIDTVDHPKLLGHIDREARDELEHGCRLDEVMKMCDTTISGELSLPETRKKCLEILTQLD